MTRKMKSGSDWHFLIMCATLIKVVPIRYLGAGVPSVSASYQHDLLLLAPHGAMYALVSLKMLNAVLGKQLPHDGIQVHGLL
jgi:hypothetical protein